MFCWNGLAISLPLPFRHGVVATSGERIAAQDAPDGEKQTDEEAPFLEGFDGIRRTGGTEDTAGRFQRRDEFLIKFHKPDADVFHVLGFSVFLEGSSKRESFFAA